MPVKRWRGDFDAELSTTANIVRTPVWPDSLVCGRLSLHSDVFKVSDNLCGIGSWKTHRLYEE